MISQIELALRAGVLTQGTAGTGGIKDRALERATQLVMGNLGGSEKSGIASQLTAHADAIGLAMVCIVGGVEALASIYKGAKDSAHKARMDYELHRLTTTESVRILKGREEGRLTRHEKTIIGFLKLSQGDGGGGLKEYLGFEKSELSEDPTATIYTILPYCLMSEGIERPIAGEGKLEQARANIALFISSEFPADIAKIDIGFQLDSKAKSIFLSTIEGESYLENRRIPRFIMIALANLLWHLQYPVDRGTGFPLSTNRCIELCREAKIYINRLLNPESSPYLINNPDDKYALLSFMRTVEIELNRLYAAYREEKLHELKIKDLKNAAHSVLRMMDQSIFMLIYRRYNPLTGKKESDSKFANELACKVGYLNQVLQQNNGLLAYFRPYQHFASMLMVNAEPLTVLDVLIIFCTLSSDERKQLFKEIRAQQVSTAFECVETLELFYATFVKPIRDISKLELKPGFFETKSREIGFLTARRLIPLVTLVIEDYQIDVNMESMYTLAEAAKVSAPITGKQQAKAINKMAEKGAGAYLWALSPFINLGKNGTKEIDLLPSYQYRMTQITQLLDSIAELIDNYRNFLLYKKFKDFLLECLIKVDNECRLLKERIEAADAHLIANEGMNRSLQEILHPMVAKLMAGLDDFAVAAKGFENVISSPDFIQKQRDLLSTKLNTIREQFSALFGSGRAIEEISDDCSFTASAPSTPAIIAGTTFVNANQVVALARLVERCYQGLSFQSRMGHKGALLKDLLGQFDNNTNFTELQIKQVVLELTRVVASYRQTWFFQAAYGHTRSAKVLIAAINDPNLNEVLPLASIIFDKPNGFMSLNENDIVARLKNLRQVHTWQEAAEQITAVALNPI